MTTAEEDAEHRLAVLTSWGLFGPFAIGATASGFAVDSYLVCLAGYTILVAAFVSHVVINWVYRTGFRPGEIAAAFGLYGVAAVAFLATWLFDPGFTDTDVYAGLTGLVMTIGGFVAYLVTRYGLSGSFSMFHIKQA